MEALAFVPLSFVEMALMKVTGTVAGNVYKSLVDLDRSLFYATLRTASIYYILFACLSAAQEYVKNALALTWRRRLTTALHEAYFHDGKKLRRVAAPAPAPRPALEGRICEPGRPASFMDNCDQRMTSEVAGLCTTLSDILAKVAASPFKVMFYVYVASGYIGFSSLCLVVAFFLGSVYLQKLVAWPLARSLVRLERAEGDFRSSHVRVRTGAKDIGLQGSMLAEAREVGGRLIEVLGVQGVVVGWRAGVMGVTRLVDYGGALVNYLVVALAVFWGGKGGDGSGDSGDRAAFVSNASFFTLTLVYTLTEVVDLGPAVSTVVSLATRVYSLLDALVGCGEGHDDRLGAGERVLNVAERVESAERGRSMSLRGRFDLAGLSPPSPRGEYEVVMMPTSFTFEFDGSGHEMEVAVVNLRGSSILEDVRGVFPSAPLSSSLAPPATVTCVMTMQPRQRLDFDSMDMALDAFLKWEAAMISTLQGSSSPWCDSVDPKTGRALRETGSSGAALSAWSEVRAFHVFLKYPVDDTDVCPLVIHPIHGSRTYPVSFFTTESPQTCIEALRSIGVLKSQDREAGESVVLSLENESIYPGADDGDGDDFEGIVDEDVFLGLDHIGEKFVRGASRKRVQSQSPLLTSINLTLQLGRHVLITGPNGAGKTTLLRFLCSRLQSMRNTSYLYLPQLPLIAPGSFLWQQLAYPTDTKPTERDMLDALHRVGLGHLPDSLPDGLCTKRDWSACLSFGEQQRLCIARVCLQKPAFAFLDEAISGTDVASGASLVREVQRGSTVVLVAHNIGELEGMFPVRVDL